MRIRPLPILAAIVTIAWVMPVRAVSAHLDAPAPPRGHDRNASSSGSGAGQTIEWRQAEQGIIADHVQLTFGHQFHKAGEPYLSPDGNRIMFQAIEPTDDGSEPGEIFEMFIADIVRDANGRITGIEHITRLSPEGSSNTCAWWDPVDSNIVYFASTMTPLEVDPGGGYNRKTGRYVWAKPDDMREFRCDLRKPPGSPESLSLIAGDHSAYQAEGSISDDGRFFLYCSLETGDGDLYVKDLQTDTVTCIVAAPGYDGGPFFSTDGKRICYRSDRNENSLLQIFVADLKFGPDGAIVGIEREYQLTDNAAVNFGPFFHPGGRHIMYASSELSMRNFEVFIIDADPGNLHGSSGSIKYGTRQRRITHCKGADVLPTFGRDGETFVWTSQRGDDGRSQIWAGRLVLDLDAPPAPPMSRAHPGQQRPRGTGASGGHPAEHDPNHN